MSEEYSLQEHIQDLHFNLFLIPKMIYGEPILSVEEIGLFLKHNGGFK